jgi:hypothetical protein
LFINLTLGMPYFEPAQVGNSNLSGRALQLTEFRVGVASYSSACAIE